MFVIILSYKAPIEKIDALRPSHLEFLDKYYEKGIFLASGRQIPLKGGVILAKAPSRAELERIITEDPFYTEDVADFNIIEFDATKFHPTLKGLL